MEVPEITRKLLHRLNATHIHRLNHRTAERIADALFDRYLVSDSVIDDKDGRNYLIAAILAAAAQR